MTASSRATFSHVFVSRDATRIMYERRFGISRVVGRVVSCVYLRGPR